MEIAECSTRRNLRRFGTGAVVEIGGKIFPPDMIKVLAMVRRYENEKSD